MKVRGSISAAERHTAASSSGHLPMSVSRQTDRQKHRPHDPMSYSEGDYNQYHVTGFVYYSGYCFQKE